MKKLPPNRRTAIIGFCLLTLSGVFVTSLFHFLGGVLLSSTVADFVGIFAGASVWASFLVWIRCETVDESVARSR